MFDLLHRLLTHAISSGHLIVIDHKGLSHTFGDGSGDIVVARTHTLPTEWRLALDLETAAGEAYVKGTLTLEQGSLYDLIALVSRNLAITPATEWTSLVYGARRALAALHSLNPRPRAKRNVAHHYDIDPRIYDLFLDPDRQYSCAYFTPGAGLDEAQMSKKRHIAAKLRLERGQRVLDIGSGWGGLALYLAKTGGVHVTGITLSEDQLRKSRERALKSNIPGRVAFELSDFRNVTGTFDRIVSVGMFEHVGKPHYKTFFDTLRKRLAPDGAALLHTIGRLDGPSGTNPFIRRHIFPGGHLPALSEIMGPLEASGLYLTDVEVLRLHYAETLKAWRQRFAKNRAIAVAVAGERFTRMWEFYLAGSEAAFRYQNLCVFQLQLTKRLETLPIVRDYMFAAERRLQTTDGRLSLGASSPEPAREISTVVSRLSEQRTDSHQ